MKFEIGKYYQFGDNGTKLSIIGEMVTNIYGNCLIAEENDGRLRPVGKNEVNAQYYREISKLEWSMYKLL